MPTNTGIASHKRVELVTMNTLLHDMFLLWTMHLLETEDSVREECVLPRCNTFESFRFVVIPFLVSSWKKDSKLTSDN